MVAPVRRHEPIAAAASREGQDLGVSGGVAGQLALVVATGDHDAVDHDHGPDGHVAVVDRRAGLVESEAHELGVVGPGRHGSGP